jgi:hypothetical protein
MFLLFLTPRAFCQAGQDTAGAQTRRRIEEEKRESLEPTQTYAPEEPRAVEPPSQPDRLRYFEVLIEREVALGADACRVLSLLLDIEDSHPDLESQISFLKQKGIIPARLAQDFDPERPLAKGLCAYMFCKTLKIKGGVILRIFGLNQRYALRELIYQEIMYPGYAREIISGKELILIVTQAADYLSERKEIEAEK